MVNDDDEEEPTPVDTPRARRWPVQRFELAPGTFYAISESAGPHEAVIVDMVSDEPVDLLVMDSDQFTQFRLGGEYEYHGQAQVLEFHQIFEPPRLTVWHLVVRKRQDTARSATVELTARKGSSSGSGS